MKKLLITTALIFGISLSANASEVYTDWLGEEWTLEKVEHTFVRKDQVSDFRWEEDLFMKKMYPNGKCWEGHNLKFMKVLYYDNFWKKEKKVFKSFQMLDKENPTCSPESHAQEQANLKKWDAEMKVLLAEGKAKRNKENKIKELEERIEELENKVEQLEN